MSESPYATLLDATITHLEGLKQEGCRYVQVTPSLLRELSAGAPATPSPLAAPASPVVAASPGAPAVRGAAPAPAVRPPAVRPMASAPVSAAAPAQAVSSTSAPADKAAAFAALRQRVLGCVKCPNLASARKNVVFGVGNIDSPLMFVGEAPGADEDVQGEPFVGAAGQLLTRMIQTMGLARPDVYIGNVLKCRPDTPGQAYGNRKPTPDEMQTCLPYLREQIQIIRPRVIVALGATAMEGLFGRAPVYITKVRGKWQDFEGIAVMPTFHPSYVLRNQTMETKRQIWEDLLAAMERLGLPISEKQRGFFLGKAG